MSQYTKIHGSFDTDDVKDGMAYFEGTGPAGKTCGTCNWRGYRFTRDKLSTSTGQWVVVAVKSSGCRKFKALTGKNGPAIKKTYRACKYYDEALG